MKTVWLLMPLLFTVSGCVTNGAVQGDPQGGDSSFGASSSALSAPATPFPPPLDMTPRLMQPVTGGAPVVGIPLGGTLYQPVTGGPPAVGLPLFP